MTAQLLLIIVLGLFLFYRQLLVSTFDPGLAVSLGVPVQLVHYSLMAALSLTTPMALAQDAAGAAQIVEGGQS